MSRNYERIEKTINSLKSSFEGTPYMTELKEGKFETKDDLLLSVVIPARNEWPSCAFTVHSILNSWESDGYDIKDLEIIIVDNCTDELSTMDKAYSHPADNGTTSYLEERRVFHSGILRTIQYPVAGNHAARNKGAEIARGKYVFFSDAHMSYGPHFFSKMIQACEESGGLVHGAIAWMGGYPVSAGDGGVGLQYTLKIGDEWKGTWAPYVVVPDKWFYIIAQGHCSVMVNRKQFLEFGGYGGLVGEQIEHKHRSYGGTELQLDLKWWMFGSTVVVHPQAIGYHLKSYRGYSWNHDDYIHNIFNCMYSLGLDEWLERAYLNYAIRGRKEVLDRMMDEAKKEMKDIREFIESKRIKTYNELLVEKPWDKLNIERHGVKNTSMMVYYYSWLEMFSKYAPEHAKEIYRNSPLQKQLNEFIENNLVDIIYKKELYKDKRIEV